MRLFLCCQVSMEGFGPAEQVKRLPDLPGFSRHANQDSRERAPNFASESERDATRRALSSRSFYVFLPISGYILQPGGIIEI